MDFSATAVEDRQTVVKIEHAKRENAHRRRQGNGFFKVFIESFFGLALHLRGDVSRDKGDGGRTLTLDDGLKKAGHRITDYICQRSNSDG